MALTLTTADSALKEDYQPAIREQLNNDIFILTQVESNSEDIEGRRAVLSVHNSRNTGVGARAEGGTLPTAGNQGYVEERIPLRYNYGRLQVSGQSIKAMKSDTGSFTRAVESEVRGVVTDLKRQVNRQCFNSALQVIAQCGTTTSDTEVVLTTPTQTELRQLEIGMLVDVGTDADPDSLAAASAITAVNTSTGTVTISDSITTTSSHYVSLAGSADNEITGLREIVAASGTLFNIAGTAATGWISTDNNNSGTNRAATDNLFETVINDVQIASGSDPDLICTSYGVRRNYANQLKSQKRFADTTDLKGGFKALTVDAGNVSIPLAVDKDNPENTAFILNSDHLTQFQMSDWEFMDDDGAVLSRVSGVDAYEAVLFKYHELATDKRNAHGILSDLTES